MEKEIEDLLRHTNLKESEIEWLKQELLNLHIVSKRSLSDIEIEYNHPTGKVKGKLKYDDDEETLILDYKGGFITLPNIEDCNVANACVK